MQTIEYNKMFDFLNNKVLACNEKCNNLQLEGRKDEANFEKIKSNVYGIFHTMLTVAINTAKDNEGVYTFFMDKIKHIPLNWETSYKKAMEYEDAEKIHIEGIKLEIVSEIKDTFVAIWEENG